MEPLKTSATAAKMLLSAWNGADPSRIAVAIERWRSVKTMVHTSDAERMELLEGICCVFGKWLEGQASADDLNASLALLRHLAGSKTGTGSKIGAASQAVPARTTPRTREVALLELPAFARS